MFTVALACIISTVAAPKAQVTHEPDPVVEQHIRSIIKELPDKSALRQELLSGARGNGTHQPWMDDMRREGVKRAIVCIDIHFDRHGRPKQMVAKRTEFYAEYGGSPPVSDAERLKAIRSSGLKQTLDDLALQRAADGAWTDLPRPKPQPFDGGTRLELFDDEWLPTPSAPLYCAGKSCLSEPSGTTH
jgi:hypothetical protein